MFLIRNVSLALATSYAYVNPVVAVLLGTGLGRKTSPYRMAGARRDRVCSGAGNVGEIPVPC